MPNRSIVYIDGFNLYYRLLIGSRYKWLDLERYFKMFRTAPEDIQAIKYFTSPVQGKIERSRGRQLDYLNALKTTPKVQVILGGFARNPVNCYNGACAGSHSRTYHVLKEKKTDVNMAVHMMEDALLKKATRFIVVSGDSDLVPPMNAIKRLCPEIKITVYVPSTDQAGTECNEIRLAAHKHKNLPLILLPKAQFPDTIQLPDGSFVRKPGAW